MDNIEKMLMHETFLQREYTKTHASPKKEMEFYKCVQQGNIKKLREIMTPLASSGYGRLSDDDLRNIKYHMVISVAMITRFCIEGRMEYEMAYSLSDLYISEMDKCTSVQQVFALHESMVFDFADRMRMLGSGKQVTETIRKTLDYIYEHLHCKILIQDLAKCAGITPTHFRRLFKEQIGITPSEYIIKKKIEAAADMLHYSEYSATEIGYYLAFSTHSHFIKAFKRYMGITPGKYRAQHAAVLNENRDFENFAEQSKF